MATLALRRVLDFGRSGVRASMDVSSPHKVGAICFAAFEINPRSRELRKHGVKLKLQEQPFQVLLALLEKPGEIITRDALRKRIWPSDTFVDFDVGVNNAIKRLRETLADSAERPKYIETVPRCGYRFIGKIERESARVPSLAVLPLENLSRDPEQEYFAEGLTEALITALAKIGELRVISRTSAMQYKGVHKPLREIAQELQVETIVEGTVLRAGPRVRITAQLIDAPKERHLWADSYERDLRDVLALQADLAQAIAREIHVKLTPIEQARLHTERRVAPQAFEAYLKGRYHWNRRSGDGLPRALEYFKEAIAKDAACAAAYSGVADCLSMLGFWGFVSPEEGCSRGKQFALKALEIDGSLAEAHASLAWASFHYDYDFKNAVREYERAIELNPGYATAHQWLGLNLAFLGRPEEALARINKALQLDPVSIIINGTLGMIYWCARQFDEQVEQMKKTLDLDPTYAHMHWGLAAAYLGKSEHELAIPELLRAVELSNGASPFSAELGLAYANAGRMEDAREILARMKELSKERYVSPYLMAFVHAALKESDEAFHYLEDAYRQRAAWMVFLKVDPRWDNWRSHPRFRDLLRRMNFTA